MKPLVEYAKLYRKIFNWSVMPLGSKVPYFKWKKYQTELPSIEQIEEWWAEHPEANIGLITGELSGVVVFDVDSEKAAQHMREKGTPTTVCAQSSLDYKKHYYFRYPETNNRVPSICGEDKWKLKLDVRADGGYIVLPPSKHVKSGLNYKWIRSPRACDYADMDIWMLQYIFDKKWNPDNHKAKWIDKYTPLSKKAEGAIKNGVPEGSRDNTAFWLAGEFHRRGYAKMEIEQKLMRWNIMKNHPPLNDNIIRKCVRSATSG